MFIHVYTGNGKGKTTAALGLALRAAGAGFRVFIGQFLKDSSSGEIKVLRKIENIYIHDINKSLGFIKYMDERTLLEAKSYYRSCFNELVSLACDYALNNKNQRVLLVLDEFMAAYNYDMLDKNSCMELLSSSYENMELVLTGRDVADEIYEKADYVTEMKKHKHPFDKGIFAREGIEL